MKLFYFIYNFIYSFIYSFINNNLFIVWYPTTVPTGIAVLRYNLAVAYAIRGELDKSGETLKQVIRIYMYTFSM